MLTLRCLASFPSHFLLEFLLEREGGRGHDEGGGGGAASRGGSEHLYSSAIFFSEKVAAATGDPADIYMQAQALFLGRHYHRSLHVLKSSPHVLLQDLRFRYLAVKCLEEFKEWHQCLMMLGGAKVDEHGNVHARTDNMQCTWIKMVKMI